MTGPSLPVSKEIHETKYREPGETFDAAMRRIARTLSDNSAHEATFLNILEDMRFLPAGRVQCAIGSARKTTPYNCLSGETEILTDQGFVRLDSIVGQTVMVLSPVSGSFESAKAKTYGTQKLNRITFSRTHKNGSETFEVFATGNHRWVLQDGTVTEDLRDGDIVKAGSSNLPVDLAGWRHGFVFGDGTRVQEKDRYMVRLCGAKSGHLPIFEQDGNLISVTYQPSNNGDPTVRLYSTEDMKSLPIDKPISYIRGFVEGLIAADGCLKRYEGRNDAYQFHSTDREIIEWLRDHLVVADFAPVGKIGVVTSASNFGPRSKPLFSLKFRPAAEHRGFRVISIERGVREETVYCVEEPNHRQIILRNGVRTGQCFVSGVIEDSYDSIMERVVEAGRTMRLGGGIGYDFSRLRPAGDPILSLGSQASGPVSFMGIYDATCRTVASAGHRRGAQMGVLRVDHPDIRRFIAAKQNADQLTAFNLSIAVTDKFMMAVQAGAPFDLVFNGKVYETVDARSLWNEIMQSTWHWAEPGTLFIDRANQMNNLWYCEAFEATNPCAEQWLPPYGACLLGSFNAVKYVKDGFFQWRRLGEDVKAVVRGMDNIPENAVFPLPQQKDEAFAKRRMGLGITGLANAGEILGAPYASPEFLVFEDELLGYINTQAYVASTELAQEKGAFPLFDRDRYLQSKFVQTMPKIVQHHIYTRGIRNSHLTSIAPTGTISLTADNVSSGIEPVFTYEYERTIQTFDGPKVELVQDYAYRVHGVKGRRANDLSVDDHLAVLATAQKNIDSSVSKTCNVGDDVTFDEFKEVYAKAWRMGAKGCTTFRAAGKRMGVLNEVKEEEAQACYFDPETGQKTCG